MTKLKFIIVVTLCWIFAVTGLKAQEQTIGWFLNSQEAYNGYTLFAPLPYTETYLIDNCGKLIHSWSSDFRPAHSVYLIDDGTLLRTGNVNNQTFNAGGSGGIVERIDENNEVIWSYILSNNVQCQHHDIEYLPNGNILVIVWDLKTPAEAITAGRNPATVQTSLWSEKIIEIEAVGTNEANIVWEWYAWDHLVQDFDESQNNFGVVADHPELINLNFAAGGPQSSDWLHINSVDYNPELNQIILSNHNFHEVWIIDHSTTTEEATGNSGGNSGMGGDLLFRWGNPQAYQNGIDADQAFFGQHDARWIEPGYPDEGKIMVFNNGQNRPGGNYSSVDAIEAVMDGEGHYVKASDGTYLPENLSWQYLADDPGSFYAMNISGAEQMPNGNLLICEGPNGHFFEVDLDGNVLWEYINPVSINGPFAQGEQPGGSPPNGNPNSVFRIKRYAADYEGLQNYDLSPGEPIEINPLSYDCETYSLRIENPVSGKNVLSFYPNPSSDFITIILGEPSSSASSLQIVNLLGDVVYSDTKDLSQNSKIDISNFKSGIYFLILDNENGIITKKFIVK
ncbi:MAG: T9SS type A sorting domain-containing protein [Clostridia bacterium]|nr:T9SS type A sorting domain-containing protein [Clostridia bacterium]